MRIIENGVIHEFEELPPEKRPQDPHGDGRGWTFVTAEHGGDYPDNMPQAILATDTEGRSCTYVPVRVNGRVVDSKSFQIIRRDNTEWEEPDVG
jgi:hypothetical protein